MFFLKFSLMFLFAGPVLVTSTATVITCYGGVQRLSCDTGLISVRSATYGRTDSSICSAGHPSSETQDTTCTMNVPVISQRCNGQTVCEFKTDALGSPDPCVGTYKYYTTIYDCIQSRVPVACEGSYINLNCGSDQIQIVSANYGRTNGTICSAGQPVRMTRNTTCHAPTSLTNVISRCNERSSCVLEASNTIFTDPCVGTYKYLTVSYFCLSSLIQTNVTCEGSTAKLSCGDGVLKIQSANYGRTDSTTCSAGKPDSQIKKIDCYANTLAEVVSRCEDMSDCTVPATNAVFSDPCYGTYKYLSIVYSCVEKYF